MDQSNPGPGIVTFLAGLQLFFGFSEPEITALCPVMDPMCKSYGKSEIAVRENMPASRLALVVGGRFLASKLASDGGAHVLHVHHCGDLLGLEAIRSSLGSWPRTYTCESDGVLLWFSITPMLTAAGGKEEIARNLRLRDNIERMLADQTIRQFYRTEVLSTTPLRDRILLHLKIMRDKFGCNTVDLRMNRGQFAGFLAVDRSTLSRELGKLQREGLIELHGSSVYTLKME